MKGADNMAMCVVDTDVISFLFNDKSQAPLYQPHLTGKDLFVSFMSVAELDKWTLQRNWGVGRIARLNAYLQQYTIFPYDRELCRVWAEVTDSERRQGRILSTSDAWIAATALLIGVPLVTHNRRHFEGIKDLTLISEG